jgi:hypothetical protein
MKKIIAILLCIPSLAMAEFYTGNQLLTKMRSTNTVDKAIALGYVMGVADAHQDLTYCPPLRMSVLGRYTTWSSRPWRLFPTSVMNPQTSSFKQCCQPNGLVKINPNPVVQFNLRRK